MKIVFMGTPGIAANVLRKMVDSGYVPALVVTQPDREKNRGKKIVPSEVKLLAEELGITVIQPEKIRENEGFVKTLKEIEPDIAVVAAYGKILPKEVLEIPMLGCINVHASLLPKLRGASPIQSAILTGEEKTGVTIMQMDEGLDTGDMILKREVAIDGMNAEELTCVLGKIGGELTVEALSLIEKGEVKPEKQDEMLATYTSIIRKEDGKIKFSDFSALEIERMTRAYFPWPGVSVIFQENPMKLCKVSVASCGYSDTGEGNKNSRSEGCLINDDAFPGEVLKKDDSGIYVATKEGVIVIEELQLPGKNRVDAGAFLRGHKVSKDSFIEK
ncbi:MAG: methionyl-tRNA formyltransferase [Firmicutes bacterium]|nr:methionyl-tRNA formyltransferase [Bacillota bacterium]